MAIIKKRCWRCKKKKPLCFFPRDNRPDAIKRHGNTGIGKYNGGAMGRAGRPKNSDGRYSQCLYCVAVWYQENKKRIAQQRLLNGLNLVIPVVFSGGTCSNK